MPIQRLEHYNILTTRFDETIAFYASLLGMAHGPAPGGDPRLGAWIYDGDGSPAVHIQAVDPADPGKKLDEVACRLGALADGLTAARLHGAGSIEHVAFACADYEAFVARFRAAGVMYMENAVPAAKLRQLFVNDPNGITIELNFR